MSRYIIGRLLSIIPVLFIVSFLVFLMLHLIPGDPVRNMLGLHAPPAAVEEMTKRLGLDKPLHIQYFDFLQKAARGDFGISIRTKQPVIKEIRDRYPYTIKLAIGGTIFATIVGVLLGIISAVNQNKLWDNILMVLSLLSVSTPSFFLALLAILFFSLYLGLFPSIGIQSPQHYILPILTLGAQSVGIMARMTRSAMLEVLNQDYIRTSRAKGMSERVIIYSHALKNALIPVLTVIGLRFGGLLAGSALIESVFGIRGIGRFMIDGVLNRDYPVVQATVLLIASTFIIINLIVDILYRVVDPRIKY
jgi:ABC-type dipeptide/oligopeptide/nickel transport system permease component